LPNKILFSIIKITVGYISFSFFLYRKAILSDLMMASVSVVDIIEWYQTVGTKMIVYSSMFRRKE
jgi:hypothetical protein